MVSLQTYGKVIREYEGEGLLTFDDGESFACSIDAVQLADGKIMAGCYFEKDLGLLSQCCKENRIIRSITAVTKDGDALFQGQILSTQFTDHTTTEGHTISMVVIATEMIVGTHIGHTPKELRCGITNFEFIGNRWREHTTGGDLGILSINLPEGEVQIHQLANYDERIKSIKAQKGIDLTCEARVNISAIDDLGRATQSLDVICRLLSLARGTKINWIYYDCYGEYEEKFLSFHKSNITWQYAPLPLIDRRNPSDTSSFIEQVYKPFVDQKDVYGLDIAIDAYLDAKRESTFLTTRALTAVIVVEFLKSRYASMRRAEYILKSYDFKKIRCQVKRILTQQFEELSVSPANGALEDMKSKVVELNRKPFKSLLRKMFDRIGLAMSNDELGQFIEIRNSLVHKASFSKKIHVEPWQQYTCLISMLDRILLKVLSYKGYILDITNRFQRLSI